MKKLKIKFVFSTCLLPILPNIQVHSQNQSSYRFINSKCEELASSAFKTLVNKVLLLNEYDEEFSAKGGSASGGNTYSLSSGICLYQLKVYQVGGGTDLFIETKKMILIK